MSAPGTVTAELDKCKPDGTPFSRIEMEQHIWEKWKSTHLIRNRAAVLFGLDKFVSQAMVEVMVRHWLLDQLVLSGQAVGDLAQVNPNLHTDDNEIRQFNQRLSALIQSGQAIMPKEGEGFDMSYQQPPQPPGYPAPNGAAPQQGFVPPPPPPMGGAPGVAPPPPGPPQQYAQQPQYAPPPPQYGGPPGPPPGPPQQQFAPPQPPGPPVGYGQPPGPPPGPPQFAPQGGPPPGPPQFAPQGPPPQQGFAPPGPPQGQPGMPPGMPPGYGGPPPAPPQQQAAPTAGPGRGRKKADPQPVAAPVPGIPQGGPPAFAPQGQPPQQFAPQQAAPPQYAQPAPQQAAPQVDLALMVNQLASQVAQLTKQLTVQGILLTALARGQYQRPNGAYDPVSLLTELQIPFPQ